MRKHLSMCARIRERGWLRTCCERHFTSKLPSVASFLLVFILFSSLLALPMPRAIADDFYEYPSSEDVILGSKTSGNFPEDIWTIDDDRINYYSESTAGGPPYYLDVTYEWTSVPDGYTILFLWGIVNLHNFTVQVYTSDWGWTDQINVEHSTLYGPYSYTLNGTEFNNSNPSVRLYKTGNEGPISIHIDMVCMLSISEIMRLIDDLSDRMDEFEKELERLKKQTNPDVVTNQTTLPTIPSRGGGLDDDTLFIDPYRTIVYTVKVSDSGSSLTFSRPYPSTSDEVTVISDEIWIAPESYTRLWINDTAGAGTELLNVSTDVTYYNIEWGFAISVQTSGASSSVRADRVTTVRLIDSFDWGWNRPSGLFAHTSTISNSISYNMEVVRCYWAFPTEDADGRDIQIDVASIEVWDDDNNLQLSKGRHYEATEAGGVSLEYRWVNTSGTSASRTIRIQFTRASLSQGESYYTVYDNDISIADTYGNAPFTTNVHHTQHGTANFEGKIIIRFDLTGRYNGEHLDIRSLIIKRSDTSLAQQYTYDSISNELRITDQSVGAGESITYTLYWDWYDEKSAVYELILGDPLILYSLLLLAGFAGLFIFLDAKSEEKRRKYAGIIIIAVDVVILIIILVVS